jgi:hypothetical protein
MKARSRGNIDIWWVVGVHDGGLLILLPYLLWLHKVYTIQGDIFIQSSFVACDTGVAPLSLETFCGHDSTGRQPPQTETQSRRASR